MTTEPITRQHLDDAMNALRFEIKADIAHTETRLIKWMVSLMVGAVAISSTIAVIAQTFFG